MAEIKFNLPGRDDMLAKLIAVNPEPHLQERFYPLLLKHAGEQKVPMGVAIMLQLAIHEYTSGMPPVVARSMYLWMPQYIEALCPNEQATQDARAFWELASRK